METKQISLARRDHASASPPKKALRLSLCVPCACTDDDDSEGPLLSPCFFNIS